MLRKSLVLLMNTTSIFRNTPRKDIMFRKSFVLLSMTIVRTDVEPPTFPNGCPLNPELFSGPLESPVALNWTDPVTNDNSGLSVTLTSSPLKGLIQGVGTYDIVLTATDDAQNNASCHFTISVKGK